MDEPAFRQVRSRTRTPDRIRLRAVTQSAPEGLQVTADVTADVTVELPPAVER